jgi:hypothetical protein
MATNRITAEMVDEAIFATFDRIEGKVKGVAFRARSNAAHPETRARHLESCRVMAEELNKRLPG